MFTGHMSSLVIVVVGVVSPSLPRGRRRCKGVLHRWRELAGDVVVVGALSFSTERRKGRRLLESVVVVVVVVASRGDRCCWWCCGSRKSRPVGRDEMWKSSSEEKSSWGSAGGGKGLARAVDDKRKLTGKKERKEIGREVFMMWREYWDQ